MVWHVRGSLRLYTPWTAITITGRCELTREGARMNYEFEGKLLVFRVLIPLVLGAFFGVLAARAGRKGLVDCVLSCLILWVAFAISDFGSRGLLTQGLLTRGLLMRTDWIFSGPGSVAGPGGLGGWEAKEPWMHWVWVAPLVMTLWIALRWILDGWILGRWFRAEGQPEAGSRSKRVVRLVGAVYWLSAIAWMSFSMFPVGEGYAQQAMKFGYLGVLTWVASVVNAGLLVERTELAQNRWFRWALVVQFGCIAAVVLQSYASLGEWVVFCGAFMTGAIGSGALWSGALWSGALGRNGASKNAREGAYEVALGMLMSFAAVAGLSLSQAYAWNLLPLWLFGVLAMSPSIMAVVDMGLARSGRGSRWRRLLGFLVLLLLEMGLVYFFVLRTEPQW